MNEIVINGISFFVEKKNGGGVRCRVGHPECPQAIYIPLVYFNDDLSLKDGVNLTWILRKRDTQVKFIYYKTWLEGYELCNRVNRLNLAEPVSDTIKRTVDLLGKILTSRGVQYQTNEDELNAVSTPLKELDKHLGAYDERFLYEHEVVCRTIDFINKQCYIVKD